MTSQSKDRRVSFRVTRQEYERVRTLSAAAGAPNISDFARNAFLGATALGGIAGATTTSTPAGGLSALKALRDYTIAVRLTRDEYQRLREFCVTTRARSISDCAREAVCQATKNAVADQGESLVKRVDTLERGVEHVALELARLMTLLKPGVPERSST